VATECQKREGTQRRSLRLSGASLKIKPKRMHWRTYERLCRAHDALSDRALFEIMEHLNRLSGRF